MVLHRLPLMIAIAVTYVLVETYIASAKPVSPLSPQTLVLTGSARHQLGTPTKCESTILDASTVGTFADCARFAPPDKTVRAGFLTWLVNDPSPAKLIHGNPIRIKGAFVKDPLYLDGVDLSSGVFLIGSSLNTLIINRSQLRGGLVINGSTVNNLIMSGTTMPQLIVSNSRLKQLSLMDNTFKRLSLFSYSPSPVNFPNHTEVDNLYLNWSAFDSVLVYGGTVIRCLTAESSTTLADFLLLDSHITIADFNEARIGGQLNVSGSQFIAVPGSCPSSSVDSNRWHLNLADASVGKLIFDSRTLWPAKNGVNREGFHYSAVGGEFRDLQNGLKWLALEPERPPVDRTVYDRLASVYDDSGRPVDAASVKVAKYEAIRKYETLTRLHRAIGTVLYLTIGYGYLPFRALLFMAIFAVVGMVFFYLTYLAGCIVPTDKDALEYFKQPGRKPPPNYRPFNALLYSVETLFPFIDFRQSDSWFPNPIGSRRWLAAVARTYLWFHMSSGWLIATLFLISLTPDGPARFNGLWQ